MALSDWILVALLVLFLAAWILDRLTGQRRR